ncbi:MAG: hypothetical protein HW386_185 [Gammaproteobacteria bacterium]|nr:hypothetical protein [Gammaproteobacteria bacterium]
MVVAPGGLYYREMSSTLWLHLRVLMQASTLHLPRLFHRDGFGQVAGLIDIRPLQNGNMVGK